MNNELPEIFQYTQPKLPDDCICNISPSQIEKFFNYPKIWYKENILWEPSEFQGSTATVIGTICHYIYKMVTKKQEVTREEINKQLDEFISLRPELNIDVNQVKSIYPLVSSAVVNNYLLEANTRSGILKSEEQIVGKVMNGIYIAGTCDRLEGDCIVDFKTVSTKPNESVIPFGYKIQLLAYAFAFRQQGYEINRIRIVYGVKPTKTIGARCIIVTEEIDFNADKLINDTLTLIGESVKAVKDYPNLSYFIFKSIYLK